MEIKVRGISEDFGMVKFWYRMKLWAPINIYTLKHPNRIDGVDLMHYVPIEPIPPQLLLFLDSVSNISCLET